MGHTRLLELFLQTGDPCFLPSDHVGWVADKRHRRDCSRRETVVLLAGVSRTGDPRDSCLTQTHGPMIDPVDYQGRIVIDPEIRFGKPCVRGTRITVGDVLSYLASGMREDEILTDFPQLTREDIRACLAFAAERERRIVSSPAA
jgi:uncharacterized protein (DUF433 family)